MDFVEIDETAGFQWINGLFARKVDLFLIRMLIVIVPMINPDGVTLGNSRTGAAGKDLNR